MKILIVSANGGETAILQSALLEPNHRVLGSSSFDEAAKLHRNWRPDLLVTEENLSRGAGNGGLRLAKLCRWAGEQGQGSFRAQALILVPISDWDRIKRACVTGAHVIVKSPNIDAVVRYVQTIADNLTTDRNLGPILFGIYRFQGKSPQHFCGNCEWLGASVSYGASQTDVPLPPVRATLLNSLLFHRRGLSAGEIEEMINEHRFLKSILKGRALRKSAIKIEIARLRRDIAEAARTTRGSV